MKMDPFHPPTDLEVYLLAECSPPLLSEQTNQDAELQHSQPQGEEQQQNIEPANQVPLEHPGHCPLVHNQSEGAGRVHEPGDMHGETLGQQPNTMLGTTKVVTNNGPSLPEHTAKLAKFLDHSGAKYHQGNESANQFVTPHRHCPPAANQFERAGRVHRPGDTSTMHGENLNGQQPNTMLGATKVVTNTGRSLQGPQDKQLNHSDPVIQHPYHQQEQQGGMHPSNEKCLLETGKDNSLWYTMNTESLENDPRLPFVKECDKDQRPTDQTFSLLDKFGENMPSLDTNSMEIPVPNQRGIGPNPEEELKNVFGPHPNTPREILKDVTMAHMNESTTPENTASSPAEDNYENSSNSSEDVLSSYVYVHNSSNGPDSRVDDFDSNSTIMKHDQSIEQSLHGLLSSRNEKLESDHLNSEGTFISDEMGKTDYMLKQQESYVKAQQKDSMSKSMNLSPGLTLEQPNITETFSNSEIPKGAETYTELGTMPGNRAVHNTEKQLANQAANTQTAPAYNIPAQQMRNSKAATQTNARPTYVLEPQGNSTFHNTGQQLANPVSHTQIPTASNNPSQQMGNVIAESQLNARQIYSMSRTQNNPVDHNIGQQLANLAPNTQTAPSYNNPSQQMGNVIAASQLNARQICSMSKPQSQHAGPMPLSVSPAMRPTVPPTVGPSSHGHGKPGPTSGKPGPTSANPGPTSANPGPTSANPGPTSRNELNRSVGGPVQNPVGHLNIKTGPKSLDSNQTVNDHNPAGIVQQKEINIPATNPTNLDPIGAVGGTPSEERQPGILLVRHLSQTAVAKIKRRLDFARNCCWRALANQRKLSYDRIREIEGEAHHYRSSPTEILLEQPECQNYTYEQLIIDLQAIQRYDLLQELQTMMENGSLHHFM